MPTGWWGGQTDDLCVLNRDKLGDREQAGREESGECASYKLNSDLRKTYGKERRKKNLNFY